MKADEELNVHFIANAGVKDIVGRGLIYNDNVALIELVKNSKDADSPAVILDFKNPRLDELNLFDLFGAEKYKPIIIIKDFGKGMSRQEIKDKWLNIAYSEKKHNNDKKYAGNKGVGRFSCDRLGKILELYTKSADDTFLHINIDWTLFENKGQNDQISSIPLRINEITESNFLDAIEEDSFEHGTVLKITELRTLWPEQKLKKLIAELEKFSPSLDEGFSVYFNSNGDFKDDKLVPKINKKIDNGILDKLVFKTTYIKSSIDKEGKKISTSLFYQGEEIFSYTATNPYSELRNISTEIHYLDTLAKSYFTKNIGIKPNNYGSVFLFYNSFRISPYGNEKNDWLGLDQRKSQGTSRNLGTRDIIGRIDINDENESFSVITSREGLANNTAHLQLIAYDQNERTRLKNGKMEYGYITVIVRQLENFVVKGLDWNRLVDKFGQLNSISAEDALKNPDRFKAKQISSYDVEAFCDRVLKSNLDIEKFHINKDVIQKIQKINDEKYRTFIDDFVEVSGDKFLEELSQNEQITLKKIIKMEGEKVDAAKEERDLADKRTEKTKYQLIVEKKSNAYLLATRRTLSPDADGLIHTIKINNIGISEGVDTLIEGLNNDEFSKEEILTRLTKIKLYSIKSLRMAELATRSGFDQDIDIRSVDVIQYIQEYIDIYKSVFSESELSFLLGETDKVFTRSISVLNLSIVLDNLLSNAEKWGANKVKFSFKIVNNSLEMFISDNGIGLSKLFSDEPEDIFKLGVRDVPPAEFEGSGIGLNYSRSLLSEMNGKISFIGNGIGLSGATFKVVLT
jgi:hypothetical protein